MVNAIHEDKSQCRYLCGIGVNAGTTPSRGISSLPVEKGQYIRYRVTGDINDTLNSLVAINHIHIDSMGFAISRMIIWEEFDGTPLRAWSAV
jgi:hypothetical protein